MPSFLSQTGSVDDMIRGVNYASAGAGIILSSGSELVKKVSSASNAKFVDCICFFHYIVILFQNMLCRDNISLSLSRSSR